MKEVVIPAVVAFLVTIICNKISAAHTFKVMDSHIEDTFKMIGEFVEDVQKLINNANFNK